MFGRAAGTLQQKIARGESFSISLTNGVGAVDTKRCAVLLMSSLVFLALTGNAVAEEPQAEPVEIELIPNRLLREVIVSHTDGNGILQLYCMKEDGSGQSSAHIF